MRLLATLKAERYELSHHSYGVVAEIDWATRRVSRQLRLPCASFRSPSGFMGPLTGGICTLGGRIYAAMWNYVVEIDAASFQIVNAASSPWMADLHGMDSDGGSRIYVAATSVEAVLGLEAATLAPAWRWGPDHPFLRQGMPSHRVRPFWRRWSPLDRLFPPSPAPEREYRGMHKQYSPYHHHHLNDVRCFEGSVYAVTKGWFDADSGSVIRIDPHSGAAEYFVRPGGFRGPHDGVFLDGRFYVTESAANGVAWREPDGRIERRTLGLSAPYFVRGLCWSGRSFLVGFTRLRQRSDPALIVEYPPDFSRPLAVMELEGFYPPEQGAAVHSLVLGPEG
ncbi:MAG: hypothetical protein HQL51_04560 [Magnetococcales bacterium]|nr:hypothetical protein [Magnetococcales bacterium]